MYSLLGMRVRQKHQRRDVELQPSAWDGLTFTKRLCVSNARYRQIMPVMPEHSEHGICLRSASENKSFRAACVFQKSPLA